MLRIGSIGNKHRCLVSFRVTYAALLDGSRRFVRFATVVLCPNLGLQGCGTARHGTDPGSRYGTFRLNFHHFDHFELDLRGYIHVRGAAFSCLRLKLADIVLI